MLIKKNVIVKVAVHGVSYFAGRNLVLVKQDKDNVFQTYQYFRHASKRDILERN